MDAFGMDVPAAASEMAGDGSLLAVERHGQGVVYLTLAAGKVRVIHAKRGRYWPSSEAHAKLWLGWYPTKGATRSLSGTSIRRTLMSCLRWSARIGAQLTPCGGGNAESIKVGLACC